jgi:hypothetical protein
MTTCCCGLSSAPLIAQTPPSEAGLVISRQALQQCAKDAARVDGLESRLKACQRDLDQLDGQRVECKRQAAEFHAEAQAWERRARLLDDERKARWSPWTWLAIGSGGSTLLILTGLILVR